MPVLTGIDRMKQVSELAGISKSTVGSIAMLGALFALWARSKTRSVPGPNRARPHKFGLDKMWLTVNGLRMHALASQHEHDGRGVPVVLIHGFGVSSRYFVPLAGILAVRYPVYAPDLPGHGSSQSPEAALDIPGLTDALSAWMDAAGIARAILIGHSMGCQIAVEFAVRYPGKADRIVLIGMPPEPAGRDPVIQIFRLLRCAVHERLSLIPCVVKDYLGMNWRVVPEFVAMTNYSVSQVLPKLNAPVMLMRGEHDALSPAEWFQRCARLVSPICTALIPGAAHAVHYSAPEETGDALIPFLAMESLNASNTASGTELGAEHAQQNGLNARHFPQHLPS